MKSSLLIKITALLMVAVTMFTLASCSLFGGDEEETTTTELSEVVTLSAKPENSTEILNFFNSAVNNIKAAKPGVFYKVSADVKDIDTGDNEDAASLIKFAKSFSENLTKDKEETFEWGTDLNGVLPLKGTDVISTLTPADIADATINTRGATEEVPEPIDDNRFFYSVNIALNDGDKTGPVSKIYDLEVNKETVLAEFQDYTDTLEVSDYDVSYNGCSIYAEINKETNEVVYIKYTVNSIVTTTVDFLGGLESLGETNVSFNYQQVIEFTDFVWDEPTEAPTEAE